MAYDESVLEKNIFAGYCCAPIMLKTGFDLDGIENEQALDALAGLCGGMRSGLTCGVLTGACCMIAALAPEDKDEIIPKLTEWFQQTYVPVYGSINCADIKKNDEDRVTKCQPVMRQTYQKAMALLEEFGYEYE